MPTSRRHLPILLAGLLLAVAGCGQQAQAVEGDGWRWLATTAADDQAFLRFIDQADELRTFWNQAEAGNPVPDTTLPNVDFQEEFVLVLSTRGRGTEPAPCGVYFRSLRVDEDQRSLTVVYEPDTSQEFCPAAYIFGQYVIAVDRSFAGPPPFDILIDEPGQAGQPAPLRITP